MPEFRLNNKIYCGSSNQASAISYVNEDGSKTTVQDKINLIDSKLNNVQLVSITATTGTGNSVGMINIPLSNYPNAKAIIPLGLDSTTGYNVYGYGTTSTYFVMGVTHVSTRAWASNMSITFSALVIY